MDNKLHETLKYITEMNRDEEFYKAYYQAGKSEETLRRFLKGIAAARDNFLLYGRQ